MDGIFMRLALILGVKANKARENKTQDQPPHQLRQRHNALFGRPQFQFLDLTDGATKSSLESSHF